MSEINVYDNPDKCGLEIVGLMEEADMSYEFNMFLVLQHNQSRKLYYARDSGCSCPTPFEGYHFNSPDDTDLEPIDEFSMDSFEMAVNKFPSTPSEQIKLIDKVRRLL